MNNSETKNGLLKLLALGFIIGIASIVPGLSGGVLAISFGIYTATINALLNIRKNFKESTGRLNYDCKRHFVNAVSNLDWRIKTGRHHRGAGLFYCPKRD